MGTTDSAGRSLEVVPFGRLPAGAMAGVLAAQRAEWLERLEWDIAEITDFVEEAVAGRSLRGSALLANDEVAGFGFFTVEVDRCLIGELYVGPEARSPEAHEALVEGVVRQIRQTRPRKRVESQSIVFDPRGFDEAFARHGFARHDRDYLVAELAAAPATPAEHPEVEIRPWREIDFAPALEVVYRAYRGTVDAELNVQYRSREGCADLLDALTDDVWCGRFDPALARVAVERRTGRCVGVAVASAIGPRAAHFGQISVHPRLQNRGVGRRMLASALAAAREAGFARATLAVTRANRAAGALYASLGFTPSLAFPVYTRDPTPFRLRPG